MKSEFNEVSMATQKKKQNMNKKERGFWDAVFYFAKKSSRTSFDYVLKILLNSEGINEVREKRMWKT